MAPQGDRGGKLPPTRLSIPPGMIGSGKSTRIHLRRPQGMFFLLILLLFPNASLRFPSKEKEAKKKKMEGMEAKEGRGKREGTRRIGKRRANYYSPSLLSKAKEETKETEVNEKGGKAMEQQ